MCENKTYKCAENSCERCKSLQLPTFPLRESILCTGSAEKSNITVQVYGKESVTNKNGAQKQITVLNPLTTPPQVFFEEFKKIVSFYCLHKHRDRTTSSCFRQDVKELEWGHLVLVCAYQMNLSLYAKNSVQVQHWIKPQVTIFPVVLYFRMKAGDKFVRKVFSNIFLSDDPLHDVYFAKHCIIKAVSDLENKYGMHLPDSKYAAWIRLRLSV